MAATTLAVTLLMQANQYKTEARQAATATGQISKSSSQAQTATGKLDKQLGGLATTAKFAVAGAATVAVTKFAKDSVQAFLGFDDAMNQSIAIMGDVSDTMRNQMADAAREVGKTTRISAEEAAEAYFFLASAGLDAEQSIAAMPQVAKFAQAGMFDMAMATDLATDAQSALGLKSDDAAENLTNLTRVTDVMVKANVLANTSVQQIAEAMTNRAGAAARALGIDVEEVAAVLAAFADQGTKGAEAGQQFGIVLRDLQTKAIANKEAFEAAGVAVFDQQGEIRNLADIIGDLEGRLGGLSDEQKRAELSTLGFTDRSIAALTTLLGTSDAIREYERELRNAGGTTDDVANKQMESFQGKLDQLKGRLKDVQIALGEGLVPVLIESADAFLPFVELLGDAVSGLNELGDLLPGAEGGFGSLVDLIVDSLPFMGAFRDVLGFVNDLFGETAESTEEAGDAAEKAAEQQKAQADRLRELNEETVSYKSVAEEAAVAADELAEEFIETGLGADEAAKATDRLDEALRRLTDPVFKAISDQTRLREAQAKYTAAVEEFGPRSQEAIDAGFNLAEAQSAADASARDLPGDLETAGDAVEALGDKAGITDETLQGMRTTLQGIDGSLTVAEIEVFFKSTGSVTAREAIERGGGFGSGSTVSITQRAHGGPVTAGSPYVVGEEGPELFIPDSHGRIVPSDQMTSTALSGAVMSGPTYNVFTLSKDDFFRAVHEAGIQADRYGWT